MSGYWSKGGKSSGAWGSGKAKGKGNKGKAFEKKDYAKKVGWENRLSKWCLRPYMDAAGSPFSTGQQEESQYLTTWNLAELLDEGCSEYCARQGVALSEGAANLQVGLGVLEHHFGEAAAAGQGQAKLGIDKLLAELGKPDGAKFLEAIAYLNGGNEMDRSEAATATAVKRFLRFFTADSVAKEQSFKKLLRFSARLYLMAFEAMEILAVVNNPRTMAAGVRKVGQSMNLPSDTTAWLETPDDQEALLWALVAAYQQQKVDAGKKKRAAAEAFDWDDEQDAHLAPRRGKGKGYSKTEESPEPVRPSKAAKGAEKAGKGKGHKATAPLASDEEEERKEDIDLASSDAESAAASMDVKDWALEKIEALKVMLEEIATKEPKERPGIQALQAELQHVPEAVLEFVGLAKMVKELLLKARYPKTKSLEEIVKKLKDMAAQAEAAWKKSA